MGRKGKPPAWQQDALEAITCIKSGQVLLHPTDTVWGLAADPFNDSVVRSMNKMKGRKETQPILVLVADEGELDRLLPNLPDGAWSLLESSNRPITFLSETTSNKSWSSACLGEDRRMAVRWVQYDPYTAFVIRGAGGALASTSANLHGGLSPTSLQAVPSVVRESVGHVSIHRHDEILSGRPSMMVAFDEQGRFELLRD
ncbi:MAG: L-threonylcarbamoyladenylate synthase [Flavobacteriales bacterium]